MLSMVPPMEHMKAFLMESENAQTMENHLDYLKEIKLENLLETMLDMLWDAPWDQQLV